MARDSNTTDVDATAPEALASPQRRDIIAKLAKTAVVLPTAAVLYNASTTVAAAS